MVLLRYTVNTGPVGVALVGGGLSLSQNSNVPVRLRSKSPRYFSKHVCLWPGPPSPATRSHNSRTLCWHDNVESVRTHTHTRVRMLGSSISITPHHNTSIAPFTITPSPTFSLFLSLFISCVSARYSSIASHVVRRRRRFYRSRRRLLYRSHGLWATRI